MRQTIPKGTREAVKQKFDGRCAYCGQKPEKLCIDHLHPVAREHFLKKEGKQVNDYANLMPACLSCNNFKATWDLEEFRSNLQWQIDRARESSINFRLAERYGQLTVHEKPIKFYFEMPTPEASYE